MKRAVTLNKFADNIRAETTSLVDGRTDRQTDINGWGLKYSLLRNLVLLYFGLCLLFYYDCVLHWLFQ